MLDGGQERVNSNSKIRRKSILKEWESKWIWGRVKLLELKWLLLILLQTGWSHYTLHPMHFCSHATCFIDVFVAVHQDLSLVNSDLRVCVVKRHAWPFKDPFEPKICWYTELDFMYYMYTWPYETLTAYHTPGATQVFFLLISARAMLLK